MAGPVRIAILANGRQARTELSRTGAAMSKLGGYAKLGLLAAGAGALAIGKSAITAEAQFSTSMRLIQAATKAPESQMGKLNDLAIKLGADTSFSASEAADAMLELAKAGIDTKTIMGGGLAGTLQLAAAGGTELGTAATIASNAMNTFNLRGQDMAKVAAALAGGANASSASVESLGQGLQQVGPGATNAGLSLQETVAALSAFDAAGIKGSDAGTSLKTMLARLVPQTDKAQQSMERLGLDFTKGNGEIVSLTNASQQLKDRLGKLSAEQRISALNTIFGSDATRAATVLMHEGAGGIREFITATRDQNAAQEMAEARMGGTAGALERLSGSVETAQLRLGQELAPAVQAVANWLADNLVPAMDKTIDVAQDIGGALEPVASLFVDLGGAAKDAAGWFNDLPGPLRSTAIQAGAAALVMPRLSTAAAAVGGTFTSTTAKIRQLNAEMSYAATRTQRLSTLTTRLSGAARTAAGVGGMVALSHGASQSSKALGTLETAAGGALLGFSVGGPWGAAIGAGAGALYGLYRATNKSSDAMSKGSTKADEMASAIDRIAAASGRARRAEMLRLLQTDGEVIPAARSLGIETNVLIAALDGNDKAVRRINNAWRTHQGVVDSIQLEKINRFLREQGWNLRQSEDEIAENEAALRKWTGGLTRAAGQMGRTNRDIGKLGNVKPSDRWLGFLADDIDNAVGRSRSGGERINAAIEAGPRTARADLSTLIGGISTEMTRARSVASSGGRSVGEALKSGITSGFAGAASQLAADAASAVDAAIRTARQHADAHSPSRKMRQIGEWMGEGLVEGMTRHERNAAEAGRRLADAALVGSGGRRFAAASVGGAVAAQAQGGGRASSIRDGHRYTFVIEGQPFTAIARREIAADRRWSRRLDERD